MVRGLTTYISKHSEDFLKDYELPHNSILIIDGDSVAINIYNQLEHKDFCFGGDYDNYANAIRYFFQKLSDCKIIPYVLFDGATQPGKVGTASKRMKARVEQTIQINCLNEHEIIPLFLNEVFKGITKKLNIAMVMCDFDCDKEVAYIAHQLNSPILSYDSDYFIYDVKYIPFVLNDNEQNLYVYRKMVRNKETNQEQALRYLRCKIFDRETFLRKTRLTFEKLPILTVYLGNDFIARVQNIPHFCRYLNLRRGNFVDNIINWLARKNATEAISMMVNYYGDMSKKIELETVFKQTVDEYTLVKSQYLKYLQANLTCEVDADISSVHLKNISNTFIDKYRRGMYHHHFLSILFHKYGPRPLIENISKPNSHTSSFPLLSAVHKILTDNSTQDLIFYGRDGSDVSEQVIPKCEIEVPHFDQIQEMDIQNKLTYFLKIINIKKKFTLDCLDLFPKSWHIFLITLKYMNKTHKIEPSFIYALVLSKIILSYVDEKLGFIRSWRDFDKYTSKYEAEKTVEKNNTEFTDVTQALQQINKEDCLKALEKLLCYFELSSEMKTNIHLYDRNLVHSMSVFQSCILHVGFLNDIFDMPFENFKIWKLYNGTLIYNLFRQLQIDLNFIRNTLATAPTILRCFEFIISQLEYQIA